jgi:hypothetical protein
MSQSKLVIKDLVEPTLDNLDSRSLLSDDKQREIIGGLDPDAGGLAIVGLGVTAVIVGAPFAAGLGFAAGFGLLFRRYLP